MRVRLNLSFTYRIRSVAVAALLMGALHSEMTSAQTQTEIEYRFKAVYLFNFLQFTEWPDSTFDNENAPIIVGVIGEDPFGSILDETMHGERIGHHPIVIRRFKTASEELKQCQVLFISQSEKDNLASIRRRLGDAATLTVSDMAGFAESGGCIGFYLERNKIHFEIDMQALRRTGLKVSSKLLRLAKILNQ